MKFLVALLFFLLPLPLYAESLSLIRDAEAERVIRDIADPIFMAAGIPPTSVTIYLVADQQLNAFVAGGMNMFLNTGVITESTDPLVLAGVMAHETGHIAGGHLIRREADMSAVNMETLLGTVLGAAAVVAGAHDAGGAVLAGGASVGQRRELAYSRVYEESADQAGLKFLDKIGFSAEGMLSLLESLRTLEHQTLDHPNPYLMTHPLSAERISLVKTHLDNSPLKSKPAPQELQIAYARIVAKILAFMEDIPRVEAKYPPSDTSIPARYAHAILYHRKADLDNAIKTIDGLIKDYPKDPYFHELKGQIYYERGKIPESIASYEKAHTLAPKELLITQSLAQSDMALEQPATTKKAAQLLEFIVQKEPYNASAWHELGVAYGQVGMMGKSYFALAEEATIMEKDGEAANFLGLARQYAGNDASLLVRIGDLEKGKDKKKNAASENKPME